MPAMTANPIHRFRRGLGQPNPAAEQNAEGNRNQAWPWVEAPPGSQPFHEVGSIPTPAAGAGETVVLAFTVPAGMDGVILGVANIYTNPSYVEGQGELTWRIRVSGRPVSGYGAITISLGSVQECSVVYGGIIIKDAEPVTYSIVHAAGSPLPPGPGTRIVCIAKGYYWPVTSSRTLS